MEERSRQGDWGTGKLTASRLDLVLRSCDVLPTFPSAVAAFLDCVADEADQASHASSRNETIRLLSADPALAAHVLRLANSAIAATVGGIPRAVEILGRAGLCRAALTAGVFSEDTPAGASGLDRPGLWKHCLATALAARELAAMARPAIDAELAHLCGLLHDIGKLFLDAFFPKSFRRALEAAAESNAELSETERRTIGLDHAVIGRRMAELWRLPPAVGEAIWLHHQPPQSLPAATDQRMILLVRLADGLARRQKLGFSGNPAAVTKGTEEAKRLGISHEQLTSAGEQLNQLIDPYLDLLGGFAQGRGDRYYRALGKAAAVVAADNQRLRERESVLAGNAKAFEYLRDFASSLSDQSTVLDTLSRIASLMAEVGGAAVSRSLPAIAYSAGQGGEAGNAVRYDGEGKPSCRAIRWDERAEPPSLPVVAPAAAILDLLPCDREGLADGIDLPAYRHVALSCAGRLVGGVLLPGGGEGQASVAAPLIDALAGAAAMALGIVQGRCRAMALSEQLAGASQVLAATQDALAEAKTLSAIGEMAAGAAHELNNPLAVISGRAQLMSDRAKTPDERKIWQLMVEQAHRISDVVTELMDFAVPPPPQRAAIDLTELLKEAADTFSSSGLPQAGAVKVDIQVDDGCPRAWADRRQVAAVIAELLANAANFAAGRIGISARADEQREAVVIAVRDDGPGMDEQALANAFTPFFSLQRSGRRRGMGLPKAKRYVENNSGRVWLSSQLGKGTCVHVQLPLQPAGSDGGK